MVRLLSTRRIIHLLSSLNGHNRHLLVIRPFDLLFADRVNFHHSVRDLIVIQERYTQTIGIRSSGNQQNQPRQRNEVQAKSDTFDLVAERAGLVLVKHDVVRERPLALNVEVRRDRRCYGRVPPSGS